jgi:hypothetical protein
VPGYVWSPGWVDWRSGNGYTGWRPTRPHRDRIVRDHRNGRRDENVRDHRSGRRRDSDWRFVRNTDMGKRLAPHTRSVAVAEGLSQTADVARPPVRAPKTVSAATVMKSRLAQRYANRAPNANGGRQTFDRQTFDRNRHTVRQPRQPTQQTFGNHRNPNHGGARNPSVQGNQGGYQGGTRQPPSHTYQPPRSGYQGGTRQPPSHTYQPPRSGYQGGTRQPPPRTYSPPRSGGSRGYNSSSSSSSSGSRSYSPPSRSSSSSSSSSSRSSSSSSSSRSSSSSSSSRSSGSSGGGGRRR